MGRHAKITGKMTYSYETKIVNLDNSVFIPKQLYSFLYLHMSTQLFNIEQMHMGNVDSTVQ